MREISELVHDLVDGGFGSDPRFADQRLLRQLRTVRGCVLTLTATVPIAIVLYVAMGAWTPPRWCCRESPASWYCARPATASRSRRRRI